MESLVVPKYYFVSDDTYIIMYPEKRGLMYCYIDVPDNRTYKASWWNEVYNIHTYFTEENKYLLNVPRKLHTLLQSPSQLKRNKGVSLLIKLNKSIWKKVKKQTKENQK